MSRFLIEQSIPSDENATDGASLIAKTVASTGGEVVESRITSAGSHVFVVADHDHPAALEADLKAAGFDAETSKTPSDLIERGHNGRS